MSTLWKLLQEAKELNILRRNLISKEDLQYFIKDTYYQKERECLWCK